MRPATASEAAAARDAFEMFERGLAAKVLGGGALGVVERDGIRFAVLASPELVGLPEPLRLGAEAAGLPIGVLQGAVLVARHTRAGTVQVSEHSARLVLYGRNVLGNSVEWHDGRLRKGDPCIVTDPRGDAMAIGTVVGSFKGRTAAVRPAHDLGTYLRDQDEGA
ncbi:MAG TPA: hypothetical protein VI796_00890 [Candidatus Thermoplasmatota archaeon]|nr:hypothetical protein [Candidatus Thermoplasmatota archaeon]